jgi:hypothetical protein
MLALTTSVVRADPSGLVDKFMREPATLWDLGMYRLGIKMDEIALNMREKDEVVSGFADFDWDKNKLNLNIRFLVFENLSLLCKGRDACENFCAKKLDILGSHLYTKIYGQDEHYDVLASYFRHADFAVQKFWGDKSDNEASLELSKLTSLRVEVQNTVCTRDLRGGPISFTKRQ